MKVFVVVAMNRMPDTYLEQAECDVISQESIYPAAQPHKERHAQHKYRMVISFTEWEQRRRNISPASDRIYPLIRAAGVYGMTRRQLGNAVDLDRDVLDELLAGMVSAGILIMTNTPNGPVYRSPISA